MLSKYHGSEISLEKTENLACLEKSENMIILVQEWQNVTLFKIRFTLLK